jgi:monoamine oxidase
MLPSDPDRARRELARVYATALGDEALAPIGYYDHDWGTAERWSSGCVSPIPSGFYTRFGDALHPPIGQLIWSGTDTAGSMDGAVRSGHRAALRVLNSLSRKAS